MTGQQIAQLIIALGPVALRLIPALATIWNKELSVEEVIQYANLAEKDYDTYIAEARAKLAIANLTGGTPTGTGVNPS